MSGTTLTAEPHGKVRKGEGKARAEDDAAAIVHRLLATRDTIADVARAYRTSDAVVCAIYAAGTTAAQRVRARVRKLRANPDRNRFRPGNRPWNDGVKGIHLSPATEFKPGVLRGRAARKWRPIGTVETRREKNGSQYRVIKVRDDGKPSQRWQPMARFVWEREHGRPVPKGCRIVHLDRDPLNDAPANLRCMTGGEALVWQRANVPGMERRFREGKAKAVKRRWELYRTIKANKPAPAKGSTITAHACAGCGHECVSRQARCPKCGGGAFEVVRRDRPKASAPRGLAAFLEQLKEVA